jgi:hypothetical protein
VISGAAAALHGVDAGPVRDVDLLMSAPDAARLLRRLGLPVSPGPEHPLFRSDVFGVWNAPALPVDIMGGFRLGPAEAGQAIVPETREPILLEGHMVFVPSAPELARLFRRFGRPKDLARAEALERLSGAATPPE